MTGCGGDDSGSSGDASAGGGTYEGKNITLATFGGKSDRSFQKVYLDWFAKETGATVALDSPTDYAKLQTQVETGNVSWDAVIVDPFFADGQCGKMLLELKNVDTSTIDPKYLGNKCSVAANTLSFNLIYDKDKFGDNPPTSWKDFFDTETFPGKRGVWGSYVVNGTLEAALMADGVAKEDVYPLDVDRALKKLDTIRDDISFFESLAQGEEQMASESVAMTIIVSTSAHEAVKAGAPYAPVWDGAVIGWNNYVIPKGAANPEASEALLNRIASTEAQVEVSSGPDPYGWTTKDIDPDVPAENREWIPTTPEHAKTSVLTDQAWWAENYDATATKWTQWVSG